MIRPAERFRVRVDQDDDEPMERRSHGSAWAAAVVGAALVGIAIGLAVPADRVSVALKAPFDVMPAAGPIP